MKVRIFWVLWVIVLFFSGPLQAQDPPAESLLEQERTPTEFGEYISDWQARWELARLLSYVKLYDESIEQYQRLLREKPDLDEARLELARVYYWTDRTEKAEELFASIPEEKLTDDARLELAEIYAMQEKYDRAVAIYEEHLRKNPEDAKVRFRLARVLSWTGDYEASIEEYERVLESRPGDDQVRRHYARVLTWAEKFDQAISQLEKSLAD